MANEWKQQTGDSWKPEKKGDEIIGRLTDIQTGVGENNSTRYTIEKSDTHEAVGVWGSTILDSRMKGIRVGEEVKIVFEGLGDAQKGKHAPKLWSVFHREIDQSADLPF